MSAAHLRRVVTLLTSIALAAAWPAAARATLIDAFSLTISEDLGSYATAAPSLQNFLKLVAQDRPMFAVANESTSGASITSVTINMTNTAFEFASLQFVPQQTAVTVTHYSPGATPGLHAGASAINLVLDGFAPGLTYNFRADVDRAIDHGVSLTNYRQALASGSDQSKWATINVTFSDGNTLSQLITPSSISGAPQNPTYSYFYCMLNVPPTGKIQVGAQVDTEVTETPPVPEPTTWLLGLLAAGGMPVLSRLRRRAA